MDFFSITEIIKEVENKDKEVKEKIEKIKRVKELTDELQEIYESEPSLHNLLQNIPKKRLLSVKGKIVKKLIKHTIKKIKNNKRRIDSVGEITCKLDDIDSPSEMTSAKKDEEEMKYQIMGEYKFSLSMQSKISVNIQKDYVNCKNDFKKTVKENVIYKKHSNFTSNATEGRIVFGMNAYIKKTFVIPRFFYLTLKVKKYKKSSAYLGSLRNLQEGEDSDVFCVLNEENNQTQNEEESPLGCFLYDDNVTDIAYLGNFSSDYINLTENNNSFSFSDEFDNNQFNNSSADGTDEATNSETTEIVNDSNKTNSRNNLFFINKKSGGLKSGVIVAIVLGCLVALGVIIGLVFYFRNKKFGPTSFEANHNTIDNKLQITNNSAKIPVIDSVQVPVDI